MKPTITDAEKNPMVQDGETIFYIDKYLNPNYSGTGKKGSAEEKCFKWSRFVNKATKIAQVRGSWKNSVHKRRR